MDKHLRKKQLSLTKTCTKIQNFPKKRWEHVPYVYKMKNTDQESDL